MSRCSLCPGVNLCLPPSGPVDAEILFVGEAPGKRENEKRQVFIGPTGEELNQQYLPLSGLRRETVRLTNAIRCLPVTAGGKLDGSRVKDTELLTACAELHLRSEIEGGAYKVLVPLGSFACRYVCPGVDLELQHGFPVDTEWGIPAFPMHHPARGLHEPKKMLQIRTDWMRLREFLRGTLRLPTDTLTPDYREANEQDIRELDPTLPIACDTESTAKREPFCLTFTQRVGRGRLIKASSHDALRELQGKLDEWEGPVLFHNWLYDQTVTERMGLGVPYHHLVDTMARAFHLGNLPQGLKALAWRELGMVMQDFEDLVKPYSSEQVLYYYHLATSFDWPKPEQQLKMDEKTGLWKVYSPQSMNTKLKRFFTDVSKNPDKDVFLAWENWQDTHQTAAIEAECGEWPGLCITHVPFEEVVHYACRDVDALIRLWPVLQRMDRNVRRTTQENWRS